MYKIDRWSTRMFYERYCNITRTNCDYCNCILYKKSEKDVIKNDNDLDEIFQCVNCESSYCFRCRHIHSYQNDNMLYCKRCDGLIISSIFPTLQET